MAAMEELTTLLQSLQALKPPGITKTKIEAITNKCVENVQSDSVIVQKIVQQFNKSPATHKLGVVYVVDSVTRQWAEKARSSGQAVSKKAAPGTFASGVQQVTDALPSLVLELIKVAPDNQKEKIAKLLDIWERGQTFPLAMLSSFKQLMNPPKNGAPPAPRSPPKTQPAIQGFGGQSNPQPVAPPGPVAGPDPGILLTALTGLTQTQQTGQTNVLPPTQLPFPFTPNVAPPPIPGFVPPPPPIATPTQNLTPEMMIPTLLQAMSSGQLPPEQAIQLITMITAQQNQQAGATFAPSLPQVSASGNNAPVMHNGQSGVQPDRFEQNGHRFRDRSRSPDYIHRRQSPIRRSPPNRRDSPTYGTYDPNAGAEGNSSNRNDRDRGRGRGRQRGRGRDEYRQRTPPPQRRQPSPPNYGPRTGLAKYLDFDKALPLDSIKVLSRTLFVGGAGGTEGEIRNIFSRFGQVQSCIVNQDKRHAFVKMVNRHDAVAAKEGMDNLQDPVALSKARQTRWGVGFGPRDCSDYTSGISVIPISRLTDADRKWVLTAEYGGTGGVPLEGGLVMEEPDIEIGAGVSSKAISRRVPADGVRRGGYSHGSGPRGGMDSSPRFRKDHRPFIPEPRHISPRPEASVAVPPAVPGFGYQLPGF